MQWRMNLPAEDFTNELHSDAKEKSSSSSAAASLARSDPDLMRQLPEDFVPGPFDVICSRGGSVKKHSGNMRYKHILELNLPAYDKAKNRVDKSQIVSSIIDAIREASPNGGFVREENGRWFIVADTFAREKVRKTLYAVFRRILLVSNLAKCSPFLFQVGQG